MQTDPMLSLRLAPRLRDALHALGLVLDDDRQETLLRFLTELQRWNRTYNLTAIRDPEEMLVHHLFDSLSVIPVLDNILDKNTVSTPVILDVGSGGGLPGIVIAIVRPWDVHCVDAVSKKTAFVRQMSARLGLPKLKAHHARVEALESLQANIVICRAFASVADFVALAGHHAAPGASLIAMKGQPTRDELDALAQLSDWRLSATHTLEVPELVAQRCALQINRKEGHEEHH